MKHYELTIIPSSTRRVTSQDWLNSRQFHEASTLPRDFSFDDTLKEDDPGTSALQIFNQSVDSIQSLQIESNNFKKNFCAPTDLDILCGRGGYTNSHPGNIRYRHEVEKVKPLYFSCRTKSEKKEVSELLVAYVQDYGARFLEKDSETGGWIIASSRAARKKVSQAFRETKWKITKVAK